MILFLTSIYFSDNLLNIYNITVIIAFSSLIIAALMLKIDSSVFFIFKAQILNILIGYLLNRIIGTCSWLFISSIFICIPAQAMLAQEGDRVVSFTV